MARLRYGETTSCDALRGTLLEIAKEQRLSDGNSKGKLKQNENERSENCLSNDIVLRNIDVWRWLGALGNAVVLHAANNTHQRLE